jgi:BarA-like signal transduction histidine kinase
MENKTFNDYSTQNYDNLLIGASRPVKPNLTISFEQLDAQVHQQMQLQY